MSKATYEEAYLVLQFHMVKVHGGQAKAKRQENVIEKAHLNPQAWDR